MKRWLMIALMLGSVLALAAPITAQQQGPPPWAGPPGSDTGPPTEGFSGTQPIPDSGLIGNTTEQAFSPGNETAIRVERQYRDSVNVSLSNETVVIENTTVANTTNGTVNTTTFENESKLVFNVTIPDSENASNVTFYIQEEVVNSTGVVDNVSLLVNNQSQNFSVDRDAGPGNSPWALLVVHDFSTNTISFENEGSTASGPGATYDRKGIPEGVSNFLDTSPITEQQTVNNSSELAGKMRVSSDQLDTVTVELQDSPSETTLLINNTNNTSTTFFVQNAALESVTNGTNATVLVDGEQVQSGLTSQGGSNWTAFKIDSFSTREVTITSGATGGSLGGIIDGSIYGIPNLALIAGGIIIVLLVGYKAMGSKGDDTLQYQ